MLHVGILLPREGKEWSEDLSTGKGTRKGQQSTGQCRPNLQPNIERNFSKDSKLSGQMDRVNERSRDFRYCFRLLDFVEICHQQKPPLHSTCPKKRKG